MCVVAGIQRVAGTFTAVADSVVGRWTRIVRPGTGFAAPVVARRMPVRIFATVSTMCGCAVGGLTRVELAFPRNRAAASEKLIFSTVYIAVNIHAFVLLSLGAAALASFGRGALADFVTYLAVARALAAARIDAVARRYVTHAIVGAHALVRIAAILDQFLVIFTSLRSRSEVLRKHVPHTCFRKLAGATGGEALLHASFSG